VTETTTTANTGGRPREIWTRLTVDPLATPLARWLSRRPGVTPNRVTAVAMLCALASAACMAGGLLRLGGALFLVRFFVDCLDGKVARAQGTGSRRGAALDLIADVGGIALVTAALGWRLVEHEGLAPAVPLAVMANLIFYNWALAYRKALAKEAGLGEGGAAHQRIPAVPLVGAWVRFCRRLNMSPVPWTLEAEIAMLGLCPLLLPADQVGVGMVAVGAFFLVANAVNIRRLWRVAGALDREEGR
jgi:phosphatidylglycerophosphate synthase